METGSMSFRPRQVVLSPSNQVEPTKVPKGVRPSYINGKPTTSTGCFSLDSVFSGGGVPLGTCLLIEESSTTDFASALLRYFAAQGVIHQHSVAICGVDKSWIADLPGVINEKRQPANEGERMKIAWRYNNLGIPQSEKEQDDYCCTFDQSKRLELPLTQVTILPPDFEKILLHITKAMKEAKPQVHRIILPGLLSPLQYNGYPEKVLRFLYSLRSITQRYPTRLVVVMTLPVFLYPRTSAIVGWMEIISDGVIQLSPFATTTQEGIQGVLQVIKLPFTNVEQEHYGFRVSRKGFSLETWSFGVSGEGTESKSQPDKIDF